MLICTFLDFVKGSVINVVIIIIGLMATSAVIEFELCKSRISKIA